MIGDLTSIIVAFRGQELQVVLLRKSHYQHLNTLEYL